MRKIRFWSAVLVLFLKRFVLQIIGGIFIGLVIFLFKDQIFSLPFGPERIGILGRFTNENLPPLIVHQISTGLSRIDEEGLPQAGIAQSWEAKEEGRIWVFHLKPGITWQNGTPIKTQEIKYNFQDVAVSYPNSGEIEFRLRDPYSAFPVLVSKPVFKRGLLGVGDWQAKRVKTEGQYLTELFLENKKIGKTKLFKFYETEQMLRAAFALGEIDVIHEISDPKNLKSWSNIEITNTTQINRFVGVFFNTKNPYFENKTLRQSLAYSINKINLGKARAISPISPNSWAFNLLVKHYDYDLKRAKELFSQLKDEEKIKSIQLVTIPSLLDSAELIAKDWRELGIEVVVQVSAGIPGDFQALLATLEIPPDPDQYSLWHSTQKETNITRFNNPRIDKLLEDGRTILDQEARRGIYLDFQRFLVEEAPAIFLSHPESYSVRRK